MVVNGLPTVSLTVANDTMCEFYKAEFRRCQQSTDLNLSNVRDNRQYGLQSRVFSAL